MAQWEVSASEEQKMVEISRVTFRLNESNKIVFVLASFHVETVTNIR